MKNFDSIVNAVSDLKHKGYDADFYTQTICLYCGDLDLRLDPEDFHVDEIYKIGAGDSSAVYAITSSNGVKGTLVDSSGSYAGGLSFEMARKLGSDALRV